MEWMDLNSLTLWQAYRMDEEGCSGWIERAGQIALVEPGRRDLCTQAQFADFELEFEWCLPRGGNSGVLYHVQRGDDFPFFSGLEYQILDDFHHPQGTNPRQCAGSLYDLAGTLERPLRAHGHWNQGRIQVQGERIQHWLNGCCVVDFRRGSAEWEAAYQASKFTRPEFEAFARKSQGHIALQDHENPVEFRGIRIRIF